MRKSKSRVRKAATALAAAALAACLWGCGDVREVEESALPASQAGAELGSFKPPEALDHIAEWYPKDWRLPLLKGLTDTVWESKLASLRRADSLRPNEPVIAYQLGLAYLERENPEERKLARPWLEKAMKEDPDNGVLRVLQAILFLAENNVPKARALFLDPRRSPKGDFYYGRLEEITLGLFSHSGHLNPYTLTEAAEIYRKVPLPPFEKFVDVLYSVYLDPLPEHPYDIRVRGRDAARGLFLLGRDLRVASYGGRHALSNGYEQRALGFMFQLKAAEFLTLFYRTFEDTAASKQSFADLADVQKEYEAFLDGKPWADTAVVEYLDKWGALFRDRPNMKVKVAVGKAREWKLWKRAAAMRYPRGDDG
jgi:hypothetical protein